MPKTETDHLKSDHYIDEALYEADRGKECESGDWAMRRFAAAQTYSTLAVATELRGIRDALEGKRSEPIGKQDDDEWHRIANFCEKQYATHDGLAKEAVGTATRETHEAARDVALAIRDEVIHGA